jgi:hypothetical protein
MIITLSDCISKATQLAGRNDFATSEASFWANAAYEEITSRIEFRPMEALAYSSTTSGENRVALPSDFQADINLSNLSKTYERNLTKVDGSYIDSQSTSLAAPTQYAIYGEWMELYPSPDSSYSLQLRYHAKLPTLVESTSTPLIDSRWHMAWVYKTTEMLHAARRDSEGEMLAQNRYLGFMGSTPSDRALQQRTRERQSARYKRQSI